MSSERQRKANRANAKFSKGPKTPAGKRKSSLNAVKHGFTAETIVVGDEDPARFEALRENFERDFEPQTAVEQVLVERLAVYSLRLFRIPVFEAAYMQFFECRARVRDKRDRMLDPFGHNQEPEEESTVPTTKKMACWLSRSDEFHNALSKLSRYEAFLMNSFNRTLQQLMFLRSARETPVQVLLPPKEEGD